MKHKYTKEVISRIGDIANALPVMYDLNQPPSKKVIGSRLLKLGITNFKTEIFNSFGGKKMKVISVRPNKVYIMNEPMRPLLNHRDALMSMFDRFGMKGVLYYQDLIIEKYSKGKDSIHSDEISEGKKEGSPSKD